MASQIVDEQAGPDLLLGTDEVTLPTWIRRPRTRGEDPQGGGAPGRAGDDDGYVTEQQDTHWA